MANSVTLAEVQEKPVEQEPQWMPRTNIILNRYTSTTRTFTLGKNSQNDDVKGVISLAIKRGCLLLFMEPELKEECEEEEYQCNVDACCLTVSGLKKLTLDALVWAAEQHGFEGENDMADRLERGDTAKYVNPLIKYVRVHAHAFNVSSLLSSGIGSHQLGTRIFEELFSNNSCSIRHRQLTRWYHEGT